MSEQLTRDLTQQIQMIREAEALALQPLQQLLTAVANNLSIQPLELAAALVYLDTASIIACRAELKQDTGEVPDRLVEPYKMVRYRIEIGLNHKVSSDEIKSVLINESGVDKNQIGYLEMRNSYSLIDLPPGMPPDIFQLLQKVEIKQQALQIKRVNMSRKRLWKRRKTSGDNAFGVCDVHQNNG